MGLRSAWAPLPSAVRVFCSDVQWELLLREALPVAADVARPPATLCGMAGCVVNSRSVRRLGGRVNDPEGWKWVLMVSWAHLLWPLMKLSGTLSVIRGIISQVCCITMSEKRLLIVLPKLVQRYAVGPLWVWNCALISLPSQMKKQ